MSSSTMSSKPLVAKGPVTNRSYIKKKCTDDLKSFNTSFIRYRTDFTTNGHANNNDASIRTGHFDTQSDTDKLNISSCGVGNNCLSNISPPPSLQHNNNNNNNNNSTKILSYNSTTKKINGKILSPPYKEDYIDYGRCCNSVIDNIPISIRREWDKGRNECNQNYGHNSLISNKFSNSSPSVFYSSTTTSNGQNNNGYYKPRYMAHKSKDKKKQGPAGTSDINRRVHGLMERFTARSYLFYIPTDPAELIQCNQFDMLNRCIWDVYLAKAQKEVTYLQKLEFWKLVYLRIQKIKQRYGLFLVGSTMSGLGLDTSDIDMCLLVRPVLGDPRSDALSHLQSICELLENCAFVKSPEVIMAKVPILKFRDASCGFEVDLNCNNSVGIRNTHLLNAYARLDWRVRPLVVIVKVWAQANDINDAKRMTINSYSLALMTLHYLQCGVSPPAIPCLQALYPERFGPNVEIQLLDLQDELPPFYSDNKQSLGELFLGFLHYFSNFNYNQFAMSIREGALLSKEECRFVRAPKNDIAQWKLLCIEEPFDMTNTARCVYDVATFEHIKHIFRMSYETLVRTKNLSSIVPLLQTSSHISSPINHFNQTNQR